ncbi:MAG: proton-conducting transporter membrane subunit [Patescibacteria group bacterium]
MLPVLIAVVLILATASAYLPVGERVIRRLGLALSLVSVGLVGAAVVGWFLGVDLGGTGQAWQLDNVTACVLGLLAIISATTSVVAHRYLEQELKENLLSITEVKHYYRLVPLFTAAMYVAVWSNNVAVIWLSLEATTLATTLLIAFYRKRSALEAAWKYLVLNAFGMGLALVGLILFVFALTGGADHGTQFMTSLQELAVTEGVNIALLRWAFVFLFIGLGAKLGLVPMHAWLPDAHSKAPSPVSALMAGLLLNVVFITLLRFRQIVDLALLDQGQWSGQFFLVFGCLSLTLPALIMLIQKNYKRFLSYSSIQAMGVMMFAVGLGPAGLIPALMYLPGHALLKSGLFFGAGEIFNTYKTTASEDIPDLWYLLPKTATLFLLLAVCLVGVPPSAIFVSQTLMLGFGLREHLAITLWATVMLTVAVLTLSYQVYRLVFKLPLKKAEVPREPWKLVHVGMGLHLLLALALGLWFLTPSGLNFVLTLAEELNSNLL